MYLHYIKVRSLDLSWVNVLNVLGEIMKYKPSQDAPGDLTLIWHPKVGKNTRNSSKILTLNEEFLFAKKKEKSRNSSQILPDTKNFYLPSKGKQKNRNSSKNLTVYQEFLFTIKR